MVGIINSYPWILIQSFIFSTWITIRERAYKGWRFASITILKSFVMRIFVVTYSRTSCKPPPEKLSLNFHILENLHMVTKPFRQRSSIPALEFFPLKIFHVLSGLTWLGANIERHVCNVSSGVNQTNCGIYCILQLTFFDTAPTQIFCSMHVYV